MLVTSLSLKKSIEVNSPLTGPWSTLITALFASWFEIVVFAFSTMVALMPNASKIFRPISSYSSTVIDFRNSYFTNVTLWGLFGSGLMKDATG